MLISYPILPVGAFSQDEDVYLDHVLNQCLTTSEGTYPVSTINASAGPVHRWHGGVHLVGQGEPIRAIADGTVVAFRFAAQCETYGTLGDYDTSFMLLKHETETGEHTPVVFYSLYMHLANKKDLTPSRFVQLPDWLKHASVGPGVQKLPGQRVWRKDVLGFAGKLYGRETCHFEVFMLDPDFQKVWRDSAAITQGNGSDDVFGDSHFVIPARQGFVARHPGAPATGPHRIDFGHHAHFTLPLGQAGQNTAPLYVSVRHTNGRRITTTYEAGPDNSFVQVGAPVVQDDYEYELYRLATALYPDCPSAGLEWLRLGRVLGPDATTHNANWQLIRYSASAVGYIDLAPQSIAKLSDADFPSWLGWEKRDEGQTANAADGLCDDAVTLKLMQDSTPDGLRKRRHLVCKAPSEWDDADLAARYARLREAGQPLESNDSWQRFSDHVQKMAFWKDAGLPDRSVWHFHPMQFVRHFRQCGWLTKRELLQLVPSHAIRKHNNSYLWEPVNLQPNGAIPTTLLPYLNHMLRKYGINTPMRQAGFFGNSVQETAWFSSLKEGGANNRYYAPWYGRGLLQLTHPETYIEYWRWRGRLTPAPLSAALKQAEVQARASGNNAGLQDIHFPALTATMINWRYAIEGQPAPLTGEAALAPVDSAGFYWVKLRMASYADDTTTQNLERVSVQTNHGSKVYYRSPGFWKVSASVNLPSRIGNTNYTGLNGFDSRCCAYGVAISVITDRYFPSGQNQATLTYPEGYTRRAV